MAEISVTDSLGSDYESWTADGTIGDYEFMFLGNAELPGVDVLHYPIPSTFNECTVVTGTSPASNFTERIWNVSTSGANDEQVSLTFDGDKARIKGNFTEAIEPKYLVLGLRVVYLAAVQTEMAR